MARAQIYEVIWDTDGTPVTGASVYVYNARTLVQATVYSTEGGGGTLTQPLATTSGVIPGWLDEGEYDLAYTYGVSSGTRRFNAIVGGNPKLATNQVTATELAADSVGSSEIQAGAVGSSEIASDAVGSDELANNAVDTAAIQAGAVTGPKIATDAVDSSKIAADAVGSSEIAADAVGSSEIAAGAVGSSEIAAGAVGNSELASGAVTYDKVDAPTITTGVNLAQATSILGNDVDICSLTAPGAGTYKVYYRVEAYNTTHSASGAPNSLTLNIKVNGTTSWTETDEWHLSTGATDDRRITFSGAFVATVTGAHVIKATFNDAASSNSKVDIGKGVIVAVRESA